MRRCPIPMAAPVDTLLPSIVRDGTICKRVTNLGWLRRNWTLVEEFDCYPHPPVKRDGLPPDFYLVARLCGGCTYETGFACLSVFHDFVNRSRNFKGVKINYHPRLQPLVDKLKLPCTTKTKNQK